MARIFTTCMYVVILMGLASIFFSMWADKAEMFQKDALNGAIGFGAFTFALSIVLIGRMKAKGNRYFTPFNMNVAITATLGVLAVCVAVKLLAGDTAAEGSGALVGAAVSAVLGGGSGVGMALAKRDDEGDE